MATSWQLSAVEAANVRQMSRELLDMVQNLGGQLNTSGQRLLSLARMAGGALKDSLSDIVALSQQISQFSAKSGLAATEYGRLQYLAQQSQVPFDAMTASMGILNRRITEVANGRCGALGELFSRLGIELRDSEGQIRTASSVLPELAAAFQRNESPMLQARMGLALFGEDWRKIMPMLAEGPATLNERMARFAALGLEVRDADAFTAHMQSAQLFGSKLTDLDLVARNFRDTVAIGLLPVLTPMLEEFIQWAVTNKDVIAGEVIAFLTSLAESLREVDWKSVGSGIVLIVKGLGTLVDWLGGAQNALLAFFIVTNTPLMLNLGSSIFNLMQFAGIAYEVVNGWMLARLRIVTVVMSLVGPLRTVGMIASSFIGGAFSTLASLVSGAGGMMVRAVGGIVTVVRLLGAALLANPLGIILGLATAAVLIWQNWDTVKSWFASFFDWIGEKFQSLLGWASDLARMASSLFGGDSESSEGAKHDGFHDQSHDESPDQSGNQQKRSWQSNLLKEAPDAQGTNVALAGSAERPSLLGGNAQLRASGQIDINIKGAPPGTRIEQIRNTGDVPFHAHVGTRTYATEAY